MKRLDEGSPQTCGKLAGGYAGVWLHRRARESLCDRCAEFTRKLDNDRYLTNTEHRERRKMYARCRSRALNKLAVKYRIEFKQLLLKELENEYHKQMGGEGLPDMHLSRDHEG